MDRRRATDFACKIGRMIIKELLITCSNVLNHSLLASLQMLLRHSHLNRISANLTAIRFINGGLFNGDNALTSPPDAQHTHFKVFEIDPPSFDIDVRALSQKYKALQTKLHPDKFASAGSDQVRLAEAWSARVNDAYQVWKLYYITHKPSTT